MKGEGGGKASTDKNMKFTITDIQECYKVIGSKWGICIFKEQNRESILYIYIYRKEPISHFFSYTIC